MSLLKDPADQAVAIVGVGAILPDAPNAPAFWQSIRDAHCAIRDVPADRWRLEDYFDADPAAPDKSYSGIGAWVSGFEFDWKRFRVPPRVAQAMDASQHWAVTAAAEVLADYGYPERPLDTERTGVILGNALGGDLHLQTHARIALPEMTHALEESDAFSRLERPQRESILEHLRQSVDRRFPPVTEDSMPGELPNINAGRVANILNLRGPNFIADAACASSLAATSVAIQMLASNQCDAVITGGVDSNMSPSSFVKFCKIGALSATGSRPFSEGADGFVMGEGCAMFLLKRLADAERDEDRIYAVIRGFGASSDGKGKGITAPNPRGQELAIRRAWDNAGLAPRTATLVEGHGTSTRVGDAVELQTLSSVFADAAVGGIALGSVKGNVGHLKAAAGAVALLKVALALFHRELPPTLAADPPNPAMGEGSPFALNHELRSWEREDGTPRRAGVSSYGFGGTNFHVVLEEHVPGALTAPRLHVVPAREPDGANAPHTAGQTRHGTPLEIREGATGSSPTRVYRLPLRGVLTLGAHTAEALEGELKRARQRVEGGWTPPRAAPDRTLLAAEERLLLDFEDGDQLLDRIHRAQKAMDAGTPQAWRAVQTRGIFRGSGPRPGKVAFLFPGQGSQYLDMGRRLRQEEPVVAEVFAEADRIMTPLLSRPLSAFVFPEVEAGDSLGLRRAEQALMDTSVTQPAILTMDTALCRLLQQYGITPDLVMGHSLGEYAALVAAGVMSFAHSLEAAAARGREMAEVTVEDRGEMAAVFAPLSVVEEVLRSVDGYVVVANINSNSQCVIGGATAAVQKALELLAARDLRAVRLPVSHAFHTEIVAPARKPLRRLLDRLEVSAPGVPLVGNVTGELYPRSPQQIRDLLEQQVAAPVLWVKSLQTLYSAGVRTFVEVGPKKALRGFCDDVFRDRPDVLSLHTNHPKAGQHQSFNHALCGLWAAGYGDSEQTMGKATKQHPSAASHYNVGQGAGRQDAFGAPPRSAATQPAMATRPMTTAQPAASARPALAAQPAVTATMADAQPVTIAQPVAAAWTPPEQTSRPQPFDRNATPAGSVVISGTGLGLPGAEKPIMDPGNVAALLRGEQLIDLIPQRFREAILDKRITRLVKDQDGGGHFETLTDPAGVIKLAGRPGSFDLTEEYGVDAKIVEALDVTTQLAMAAGLDALREAGIPLVRRYRRVRSGKHLPDRWMLPEGLRDETGVIFASAFAGVDRIVSEMTSYHTWRGRRDQLEMLEQLRSQTSDPAALTAIGRKLDELRQALADERYEFDRRFLYRVLSMGHSQVAEYIGARGPNTAVNTACASTTTALAQAEDWIRSGRCRRVLVVGADNVTGENLLEWMGAGFQAMGAAATEDRVQDAALPFDRRRHGMIMGMGAAGFVVESEDAARERGMRGIVEVLSTESRNSAFHGSRLDTEHIAAVMNSLVTSAERRFGLNRLGMAPRTVFVSHETYTPARGGSAAAEVAALRRTFGDASRQMVITNTKGYTGHPMGVGIEDVMAVKMLEHSVVPPVPNHREEDPDLGPLNLSRGGSYPVQYALRLAAGFGSQIALTLLQRLPGSPDRVDDQLKYQRWLWEVSGQDHVETEVVKRVLRLVDGGVPTRPPAPSPWRPGQGPGVRTGVGHVFYQAEAGPVMEAAPVVVPLREPSRTDERGGLTTETTENTEIASGSEPEQGGLTTETTETTESPRGITPESASEHGDELEMRVKAIVAEQTGYPVDMLEMDLDLEADLGIDTVKQAETFAEISELFDIDRGEELRLRDYPTLGDVVQFVRDNSPEQGGLTTENTEHAEISAGGSEHEHEHEHDNLEDGLAEADTVPRRVPVPVLRPALQLCKPTGVSLDGGSRVVVMMDGGGVGDALVQRLEALGAQALTLDESLDAGAVQRRCEEWLEGGAIQGVYWLPALDVEPGIDELSLEDWRELLRRRVKLLYATMRGLSVEGSDTSSPFLVSGTRLGGLHGYEELGATAPMGGAVAGFTKAYGREREGALVKAVDCEADRAAGDVADALVAETLTDPGVVEVGLNRGLRYSLTLQDRGAADGGPGMILDADSVFVITGAAGGIVSAIVADLAAASGGTFHLLDLAGEPRPDDPRVALFRQDRQALKQELLAAVKADGGKPREVEQRLLDVERQDAAQRAVEAVEAAGGTAHYHGVDLRDGAAVASVLEDVRARHDRVDVMVHGAGVEISRPLARKERHEFDLVFDVKADGMFNLLAGAKGMPLGAVVVFSSVAGRFGNAGQTDYSAANDLLCKVMSSLRRGHPETRGIAIDWTAWSGIGMATRGSIPKLMERAGIEMLRPEAGIPTVRRELTRGATRDEIVVGRGLGALLAEHDAEGGLDPAAASEAVGAGRLMIGEVTAAALHGGLLAQTSLDPGEQPFLYDHHVEPDLAYLPGVMGMEAFAELAQVSAPEFRVTAVQDVQFASPFKFYRGEPRQLLLSALVTRDEGGDHSAAIRLESVTDPGKPGLEPRIKAHFFGSVRLTQALVVKPEPAPAPALDDPRTMEAEQIYASLFHGPAYQVLQKVTLAGDTALGHWAQDLPPDTAPAGAELHWAPRLVELCFQTAGVWQLANNRPMGLPQAVASVEVHAGQTEDDADLCAVVTARQDGATFDARVVGPGGQVHLTVTGYHTTEG